MPPLAAVPDLQSELDALYALPAAAFTRARNDLAARLKRAHQLELSNEVRQLKKPSIVAACANQLARDKPDLVGGLLEAADELLRAQQRALAGDASAADVVEATATERDAMRALVTAARPLLGARATPAALDRLGQTLRAAAADAEKRLLLARGRLTEELQSVGFGGLEPVVQRRRRTDDLTRAARERVAALRAEAKRRAEDAEDAAHAAAEAARTAELLQEEAEQKLTDANQAQRELADAEADLSSRR